MTATDYPDLLTLLAEHPSVIHARDRALVRAAILADGKTHAGVINSNRVLESLTNDSGELDVFAKSVGPQYYALKKAGLIVEAAPARSTDVRGRNAGRWIATYELTAAGWSA